VPPRVPSSCLPSTQCSLSKERSQDDEVQTAGVSYACAAAVEAGVDDGPKIGTGDPAASLTWVGGREGNTTSPKEAGATQPPDAREPTE
jgi:hypothetical protein